MNYIDRVLDAEAASGAGPIRGRVTVANNLMIHLCDKIGWSAAEDISPAPHQFLNRRWLLFERGGTVENVTAKVGLDA
jgi:hypothetical protein